MVVYMFTIDRGIFVLEIFLCEYIFAREKFPRKSRATKVSMQNFINVLVLLRYKRTRPFVHETKQCMRFRELNVFEATYHVYIYVMRKVRIGTILELSCANLGSELCATILGLAAQSTDCT